MVTGKSPACGGSQGRDKATAQGLVYLLERWAGENDLDLSSATYTLQGFGNVGSHAARLLEPFGARCLAVADHLAAVHRADIVSYFEWTQNKNNQSWELDEIDMRLKRRVLRA